MADPNPPPAAKLQEFQRAVSQKDDNATLRLLREFPVLLDRHLDSSGRTGLMHAAHNGRCNPLRALLRRGAAVDIQTGSGATAVSILSTWWCVVTMDAAFAIGGLMGC